MILRLSLEEKHFHPIDPLKGGVLLLRIIEFDIR